MLVLALVVLSGRAQAQNPAAAASPLLPPDHWAVEAARRLDAMGLAPAYVPAQAAVPRGLVAAALREAADTAEAVHPAWSGMAAAWWWRFVTEFPEYAADAASGTRLLGSHAGAGAAVRRGAAGPGRGEFPPDRTGATALPDRSAPFARAGIAARIGDPVVIAAAAAAYPDRLFVERGEVAVGWRRLRASVGRAEVGWGTGVGGGVIFSGTAPLDRLEISTSAPVRLPSVLRWLGPFAFEAFVSRLPDARHPGSPTLIGSTASARPHPRFTVSGHRALLAGGDAAQDPVTAGEIFPALIGKNIPGMNQIASTSALLRLPTERWIPVSVYCEWGAEDSAGAPFDAPGLVCGGFSPVLPGLPELSLGLEHAQFGARPPHGPPWYRHQRFPGNWALDEAPLGHALGGEGKQWLAYAELSALGGRLEVDAQAFRRRRTGENLFVPGREGDSSGMVGEVSWRVGASEVTLSAARETGPEWSERQASVLWRVLF